jgi:hypothetical protein
MARRRRARNRFCATLRQAESGERVDICREHPRARPTRIDAQTLSATGVFLARRRARGPCCTITETELDVDRAHPNFDRAASTFRLSPAMGIVTLRRYF